MQDLNKFKNEMNLSGQNVYVGHRYVPKIFGEWDKTSLYEPLSIVQYQGASYTSRQYVPVGIEITNEEYWVVTGNYNEQIEQYRQDVIRQGQTLNEEVERLNKEDKSILTKLEKVKNQGLIPVTHFDVVADGVTNDHGALQAYVKMMEDEGFPYMYFPTFTQNYLIEDSIKIHTPDVRIFGDKGMQMLHPSGVPMKKGNILVGGVARTGLDIGAYRNVNDSRNPAGSWTIEGLSFMPAPNVTRGTKNGVELTSMQNGPDRPYLLSKLSFDGLNNAIYMPPKPDGVSIMAANLKITDISAYRNTRGIFLEGPVFGATITNNNLEGNTEGCVWGNFSGYVNISENMLENTKNPIKIYGDSGRRLVSKGNYFEYHPTSEYLYHIDTGLNYVKTELDINQNITSGGINMAYPIQITGDGRVEIKNPQFKVLFTNSLVKVTRGSNLLEKQGHYAFDSLTRNKSTLTGMMVYVDDWFNRTDINNEWKHDYPDNVDKRYIGETPMGKMDIVDLADGFKINQPLNYDNNNLVIVNLMCKVKSENDLLKQPQVNIKIQTSGGGYSADIIAGGATVLAEDMSNGDWVTVSIPIHKTTNGNLGDSFILKVDETYRGQIQVAGATSKSLPFYKNNGTDGITKISPVRPNYKAPEKV